MPKAKKPAQLALHVVFDTNVLYTGSASYFLRQEIAELVSSHVDLPDLRVIWYIPEIVRHERQFQMMEQARSFLPSVGKLERLLGNPLNITADLLEVRVREAVDRQIADLGLSVRALDHAQVDWPRLMLDAAYRRPPFESGDTEKGFRDAVILETFVQLAVSVPTTPAAARLALVTGDALLRNATATRCSQANNIHIITSVDELKGLINTLGSTVDEAFLAEVRKRAAEVFYKSGDETTLYFKAQIGSRLQQALTKGLTLPPSADRYTIERWTIALPRFVRKQRQLFNWITRFQTRITAIKSGGGLPSWSPKTVIVPAVGKEKPPALTAFVPSSSTIVSNITTQPFESSLISTKALDLTNISQLYGIAEDQTVATGTASVDVSWTLTMTTAGNLIKPQVQGVDFVEVIWG